jgi:hypothetical protein
MYKNSTHDNFIFLIHLSYTYQLKTKTCILFMGIKNGQFLRGSVYTIIVEPYMFESSKKSLVLRGSHHTNFSYVINQ